MVEHLPDVTEEPQLRGSIRRGIFDEAREDRIGSPPAAPPGCVELPVAAHPVPEREDAENLLHAVVIHLDHDLEEPQPAPHPVRGQRLVFETHRSYRARGTRVTALSPSATGSER